MRDQGQPRSAEFGLGMAHQIAERAVGADHLTDRGLLQTGQKHSGRRVVEDETVVGIARARSLRVGLLAIHVMCHGRDSQTSE